MRAASPLVISPFVMMTVFVSVPDFVMFPKRIGLEEMICLDLSCCGVSERADDEKQETGLDQRGARNGFLYTSSLPFIWSFLSVLPSYVSISFRQHANQQSDHINKPTSLETSIQKTYIHTAVL